MKKEFDKLALSDNKKGKIERIIENLANRYLKTNKDLIASAQAKSLTP